MNFVFLYSLENIISLLVRQERVDLRFDTTKFPNAYNSHSRNLHNLLYNYNSVSIRACVRPTRQFCILMNRRNWPGRSDSENGIRPGQSDSENGRPDRAGRGRGAGGRAGPEKTGFWKTGFRRTGGQTGRGRGQGKAGRTGAK